MKRRYTSRPAPVSSGIVVVVGIFMLIFAIGFFSKVKDAPAPVILFFVIWIAVLILIIGSNLLNATTGKGIPTQIIETEDEQPAATKSSADRLQELETLRTQKLISDPQYESKRQEILKQL